MTELLGGVARTRLTPWWGVELTGLGYYLKRTWTRVRDHLAATALVLDDGATRLCWIAVDLMVIDRPFADRVRDQVHQSIGIPRDNILIGCSHSHNAPSAGGLLGVGDCDPDYERWASRQAATAAILADHDRRPVTLSVGHHDLDGLLYNRTRPDGPVDKRLTVLWGRDSATGSPAFGVINFQGHPTIQMALGASEVSRDWPGQVADLTELRCPGLTTLFFMGSSGDLNLDRKYETPERCHEPGREIAEAVRAVVENARPIERPTLAATLLTARLPTKRYERAAIERERAEALRRLNTKDTSGWRETLGRVMVNRPDVFIESRYGGDEWKGVEALCRFVLEWSEPVLAELDSRPEILECQAQAFRVGDVYLAAQPSELFSEHALTLRRQFSERELMMVGYANERIGYVPDAFDLARQGYASYQSPRYCRQFPFTEQSGPALVQSLLDALDAVRGS